MFGIKILVIYKENRIDSSYNSYDDAFLSQISVEPALTFLSKSSTSSVNQATLYFEVMSTCQHILGFRQRGRILQYYIHNDDSASTTIHFIGLCDLMWSYMHTLGRCWDMSVELMLRTIHNRVPKG